MPAATGNSHEWYQPNYLQGAGGGYFSGDGKKRPLFTSTGIGSSPYNQGSAPGSYGYSSHLQFNSSGQYTTLAEPYNFSPPKFDKFNQTPLSIYQRRRLQGTAGVGGTFLTGPGGVKGQSLGYSTLLGQ